jgi:hypothetical protein
MRTAILLLIWGAALPVSSAQPRKLPLDAATLKLANVKAEPVTWKGRAALRVTDTAPDSVPDGERYAVIPASDFQDGVIELDLTGDTLPNKGPFYRGFTGIAFRMSAGNRYEAFYLRPKNGRSEDQEQRNHSAQYISHPEFHWQKLRQETPSRYETYVDLVPGEWNHMKIEVHGDKARLYVNGAAQPTLIVNDLKHGASKGALALWIGPGTVAHFANLQVTQ